jgi:hypothetical protein
MAKLSSSNHNFIPLPSMEEIEKMDQQRTKAIESLEISEDQKQVKCQGCGRLQPIINDDSRLTNSALTGRIVQLENRIRYDEKKYHHHGSDKCEKEKAELADLLEQEKKEKKDILRRIPLYSNRTTGFRFVCSRCWEEMYWSSHKKE